MASIYFGGSRNLAQSGLLWAVCQQAIATGYQVHVGCCVGADAQVIQACPSAQVFAAFGPGGVGAWACSAVAQVAAHPGQVSWWAGGGPALPLVARLKRRSLAALAGCAAAVFFQPSPGSLAVAAVAAAKGLPVFAFSASAPASLGPCSGCWQPGSFAGFSCWVWQPAATQPALF